MCGIAGFVEPGLSSDIARERLLHMTDAIIHRGPDDAGIHATTGGGIGMRRLSIIDVSGGHQPIANETGDMWVVCNGEIYNHHELRRRLESQGHHFRTGSDSEVVIHLYEQYGDDFAKHLRGMFGLAIWDSRADRVIIARDRLGKKPLFVGAVGDRYFFGSEMKSLLAAEPRLAEVDYSVLGFYLQFGYITQPETIYGKIRRLPAGHLGIIQAGRYEEHAYWQLHFAPDYERTEQDWYEALDSALRESTRIRLESEVPLGAFLSGGLDSSGVVALSHEAGLHPIKTFTVGFDRREWDESEDALCVAKHFATDHHVLHLSEREMRETFEQTLLAIAHHCDEPFGDSSAIPTYHISRQARQHVTVILSGDGGDELFAGYSAYRGVLFGQSYRRWLPNWVGASLLPTSIGLAARVARGGLRYKLARVAKVCADSALPFAEGYRDKTSIWRREQLAQLLIPDMYASCRYLGEQYLPANLWQVLQSSGDIVGRLTEIDIQSYMLDDILVKVDRMSMAHSLEVRCPLLDHQVVELAATMPTEMKIRGGRGKYMLRRVLEDKLPRRTLRKGKQGFSVPLREWFRGDLRELVRGYLGPGGYLPPGLFDFKVIESVLEQHERGVVDHSQRIWLLLALAAWHRTSHLSYHSETAAILPGVADWEGSRCES